MRLISAYIDNYGTLSDRAILFSEGVNEFKDANGSGKSTLSGFLCAMLYGLSSYNAKTRDFSDRQHYYPFNNGNFGGSIELETDAGDKWKIERIFGEKSATKDTIKVIINGREADLMGVEPGVRLFGIDEESFKRTIYSNANDITLESTGGINTKLGKYVENNADGVSVNEAINILASEAKKLKPARGTGEIDNKKEMLLSLQNEVKDLQRENEQIDKDTEERRRLGGKLAETEAEIAKARSHNTLVRIFGQYDMLVDAAAETEAKIKNIESGYPKGLPSEEKIDRLEEIEQRKNALSVKAESLSHLSDEEKQYLINLKKLFEASVPDENDITDVKKLLAESADLSGQAKGLENAATLTEGERKVLSRFANGVPDDGTLAEITALKDQYEEAVSNYAKISSLRIEAQERAREESERNRNLIEKREIVRRDADEAQRRYDDAEKNSRTLKKKKVCAEIIGALLMAVGIAGIVLVLMNMFPALSSGAKNGVLAGLCAAAIGGIVLVVISMVKIGGDYKRSFKVSLTQLADLRQNQNNLAKIESEKEETAARREADKYEGDYKSLQFDVKRLEDKLRAKMVPYGYFTEGHPESDASEIVADTANYHAIAEAENQNAEKLAFLREKSAANLKKAENFLEKYYKINTDDADELQKAVDDLKVKATSFLSLRERERNEREAIAELEEQLDAAKAKEQEAFLDMGFGVPANAQDAASAPAYMRNDLRTCENLKNELKTQKKRAEDFRTENNLSERPADSENIDIDMLAAVSRELSSDLMRLDDKIRDAEERTSKLPEKLQMIDDVKETIAHAERRLLAIQTAQKAISEAEEKLKLKYVEPVLREFMKYANKVECFTGEKVEMDADYHVSYVVSGRNRDDRHLSSGQRAVYAMCLRLALVDSVFTTEKPFLIMDDPFMTLDEKHMQLCAETLNELAASRQIIYFTCHDSRKIS